MKAIKLIEAMCYDSNLAEFGGVWESFEGDNVEKCIEDYFGDFELVKGKLTPGKWLYVWECNGNDIYPFQIDNPVDVILQRHNPSEYDEFDRHIWLWKIESR